MIDKKDIAITCSDDFQLTGTLYTPADLKAAVMFAPATGIKRRLYNSLATHLAENGYGAITFDNRGIGDSKTGSINSGNPSLITWGRLDMSAALEELKIRFPKSSYHLLGHSAGGQLVGLMENSGDLKSIFNFACSSGCLNNMSSSYRFKAKFFMNFFIPINNFLFGKTNSHWVGMGEPLPKKVAAQWSKWCNGSGYVATDFGKEVTRHTYDDISIPSMWIHASDDKIANWANVKDMMRVFTKSPAEIVTLRPSDFNYPDIGHMGFFSSKRKELWPMAIEWLDSHL